MTIEEQIFILNDLIKSARTELRGEYQSIVLNIFHSRLNSLLEEWEHETT